MEEQQWYIKNPYYELLDGLYEEDFWKPDLSKILSEIYHTIPSGLSDEGHELLFENEKKIVLKELRDELLVSGDRG